MIRFRVSTQIVQRGAAALAAFRVLAPGTLHWAPKGKPRLPVVLAMLALLAAVAVPAAGVQAETKRPPESAGEVTLSFAPVVQRASPAVVNIYTKVVVKERPISPLFSDPFFRRFFGEGFGGAPRERILGSLGSGVLVREDGYIVTNSHVIDKAQEITVVLSDRREFPAKLVMSDERSDLAILRIDTAGEKLPYLEMRDSDDLEVGDLVIAVGNPFGFSQTVTSGIVSALARTKFGGSDFRFYIQTDAAINPGNSGGALVSMDGKLVGINTVIFSETGSTVGIGFAVPSNMVRAVLRAALTDGKLRRPWLGASGQDVTAEIAASLGLKRVGGVILSEFHEASPARKAGLRDGDIITEVNGRDVVDGEGLRFRMATLEIGGQAKLTVVRNGRRRLVPVDLVPPPEVPPRNETVLKGDHPFAGTTVANLSPALSEEVGLRGIESGVIVLAVARGSPANFLKIQPGDILLTVNNTEVTSVRRLKSIVTRPARVWRLTFRRGGQVFTVTFRA